MAPAKPVPTISSARSLLVGKKKVTHHKKPATGGFLIYAALYCEKETLHGVRVNVAATA